MEQFYNLLYEVEKQVNVIQSSIKITFGNFNLVRQQLNNIIESQGQLIDIAYSLDDIIQATYKKPGFPIFGFAAGVLMTLLGKGGAVSEFGVDLAFGAFDHRSNWKEKAEDIRKRCIALIQKIEDIIPQCELLINVAEKSLLEPALMKKLHKKQFLKHFADNFCGSLAFLLMAIAIVIILISIVLMFDAYDNLRENYLNFLASAVTFLLALFVCLPGVKLDRQWQELLNKTADNDKIK